jgi:solute carrier family 25 folate transporter 32
VNSLSILRSLLHSDRPIHALYRGLTPNLVGNASSWAIFFFFKSVVETQLRTYRYTPAADTSTVYNNVSPSSHHQQRVLSPADYFLASGFAGIMTSVATNPVWVLKTRMLSSDAGAKGAYPSMWAGAKDLWSKEGWRGFYRGLGASCLGVSHGAVQFAVYDPFKRSWMRYVARRDDRVGHNVKLGNEATLMISAAAKIVAGTATYPYQVIRSRLQTYDAEERFGKGIRGVVRNVWREHGLKGFYKGVGPNILRVMPATWVTFLVYENVRYYLPTWTA